jgi:hypothetical protein
MPGRIRLERLDQHRSHEVITVHTARACSAARCGPSVLQELRSGSSRNETGRLTARMVMLSPTVSKTRRSPGPTPSRRRTSAGIVIRPPLVILASCLVLFIPPYVTQLRP